MSAGAGPADLLGDEHEEHENHEAWVIPYADMLTLLMALFMMLFAISSVDLAKFEALANGLHAQFGGDRSGVLDGGRGVTDGGTEAAATGPVIEPAVRVDVPAPTVDVPLPQVPSRDAQARARHAEEALVREEERSAAAALDREQLVALEVSLTQRAQASGVADSIAYRHEARGLVVTVVTDQVLFAPGQADLQPAGATLLAGIASALHGVPNQLTVEGHTDDVPISTARFRSNWELSTARATEVLRHLVELGVPADRLAAAGYGEQRPLAANDHPAGRAANRRVELVVHSLTS